MKWLKEYTRKLERKYHHLAIQGLMNYIVILQGIVYAVIYTNPLIYDKLVLNPALVLRGEVWRLVTFIFLPPLTSLFFIFLTLYFYSIIGTGLENVWGIFRFNLYYLVGVLATIAVSFISGASATSFYLNLSLFLAFARVYPDFEVMVFFFLPVKMRILSWIYIAMLARTFLLSPLPEKLIALASVLNFLLFFGEDIIRQSKTRYRVYDNRRQFQGKLNKGQLKSMHRCASCGITEKDDPDMEFRYCSKCSGDYEYCMEHLKNHEHKTDHSVSDE